MAEMEGNWDRVGWSVFPISAGEGEGRKEGRTATRGILYLFRPNGELFLLMGRPDYEFTTFRLGGPTVS